MFYSSQNQAVLRTLCPTVQAKAILLLSMCEAQGIWLLVTSGYRNWAQQAWAYASGRYRPGKIITYAKPGYSFHQYRVAFDFVPADGNGGLHYEDTTRIRQVAQLAKAQGWEWGGDFPHFIDAAHLQFTGGHLINYFRNGGTI